MKQDDSSDELVKVKRHDEKVPKDVYPDTGNTPKEFITKEGFALSKLHSYNEYTVASIKNHPR